MALPSRHQLTAALLLFFAALAAISLSAISEKYDGLLPPLNPAYLDRALPIENRIEDLLSHMTLEEKVGQMALVEHGSISPDEAARFSIGGILSGGGGKPEGENTPRGWARMVAAYDKASRSTRLKIPVLYGADANHGQGNVPGATIFPHFLGLGAANDEALVERVAQATARESRALGILWIYSPTLDLPRDIRWGRVYEAFGDDPKRVSVLGAAFVHGMQKEQVVATAKHYIGLGSMRWGSSTSDTPAYRIDQGNTPADEAALRQEYLPPFRAAVDAGVGSVMVGLNTWGPQKLSASTYLITDVLKGELGFNGFVVSDWYGVYEVATSTRESAVRGINAGIDMVMLPYDYDVFVREVTDAVRRGEIPQSRIDDAVRRILRQKFAFGLFEARPAPDLSILGSSEHRTLAREVAGKSLVLLKDTSHVLPIATTTRTIRVAGSAADNTGLQSGGWTIEWQGVDGNVLPGATSILAGIKRQAGTSLVQYAKDGAFAEKDIAEIGIAVVGEKPYAEGLGDNELPRISREDRQAIARMRGSVQTLVVVIIAGRPLIVTDDIPNWDAVVMAWLPGSEGDGFADVLFGHVPFTGTLPLPWPARVRQLPMNPDGTTSNGSAPLFPRGYGLKTSQ